MKKRTFLYFIAFSAFLGACDIPDIGVAYNPTYETKQQVAVNLNEINGSWAFNTIEAATNKGRYSVSSNELQAILKTQAATSLDANIHYLLRNKMEFDEQSVKAYIINETVPVQGAWKFTTDDQKLVLFADTDKAESYFIEGLTNKNFAMKTSSVILSEMPSVNSKMTFDQALVELIGQKIIAAKEPNSKTISEITSIQIVLNYQK